MWERRGNLRISEDALDFFFFSRRHSTCGPYTHNHKQVTTMEQKITYHALSSYCFLLRVLRLQNDRARGAETDDLISLRTINS